MIRPPRVPLIDLSRRIHPRDAVLARAAAIAEAQRLATFQISARRRAS